MTQIVVLAGGLGTRMKKPFPKALVPINGRPIIKYLLDSIEESGICDKTLIVLGYKDEDVKKVLGNEKYIYAYQEEQLGTGHAVKCGLFEVAESVKDILVLYTDHAFIKPETIKKLNTQHITEKAELSLMVLKLPDFEGWRKVFWNFGRIVRDTEGNISNIVEFKEATDDEKQITEVNPSYFCFDKLWLQKNIKKLCNNNSKQEYYLTDLIDIAIRQGDKISSIVVEDPIEGMGINTPEELEIAERIIKERGF